MIATTSNKYDWIKKGKMHKYFTQTIIAMSRPITKSTSLDTTIAILTELFRFVIETALYVFKDIQTHTNTLSPSFLTLMLSLYSRAYRYTFQIQSTNNDEKKYIEFIHTIDELLYFIVENFGKQIDDNCWQKLNESPYFINKLKTHFYKKMEEIYPSRPKRNIPIVDYKKYF